MMKIYFFSLVLIFNLTFGQKGKPIGPIRFPDNVLIGQRFKNPINVNSKIQGSPYSDDMFSFAEVEKTDNQSLMRFNVYKDEMEFISLKNDTLILDKTKDYGEIFLNRTNKRYNLTTYINNKNKLVQGYLITCHENEKYQLLKKENVIYLEERIARTSFESTIPGKFYFSKPYYFLNNSAKIPTEFPSNKKGIIKLFPDKKTEIDAFFKENKINFENENDLMKIVDLLAGL